MATEMNRITLEDERDFLDWRPGSGGTIEIFDIQVGSERRQGKGRKLVEKLFDSLPKETRVYAITRADNEIAIEFYQALQFRTVNVLRRFYSSRVGTDALMFCRKAGGPV